ncbi:MAG: sigma-70 family RNA polymerase sigma factor [Capsulimonas sp.]|uniref:RNA polymerase sigma factor n=1 Tax=Capsulimonas sp. TaxID=2494211 RepID=UPI003267B08B
MNPITNNHDDKLMERIQERDEAAFELLVQRYQDALRRHLLRTVRDEDAAGDLLQELLLRVWTKADQWDGRGGVRQWLFRAATNLALNHLRSVRRRRETALEAPPTVTTDEVRRDLPAEWIADASETPEEAAQSAESARRLRGMIGQLSDEKREVWTLVHEDEMDMAGAAEKLGIPTGTVKSRLYHARQQLAREWSEMVKEWENIE